MGKRWLWVSVDKGWAVSGLKEIRERGWLMAGRRMEEPVRGKIKRNLWGRKDGGLGAVAVGTVVDGRQRRASGREIGEGCRREG